MANPIEEYANQKSMATPGVTGALIMFIANTINFQFELGDTTTKILVMILSFLTGLIVIADGSKINIAAKIGLYVINSLIIFCVATGTNSVGRNALSKTSNPLSDTISIKHIRPVTSGYLHPEVSIFILASYVEDSLKTKTEERKQILQGRAIDISNKIQAVESELKTNKEKYSGHDQKLHDLKQINEELLKVHDTVFKEETITYTEHRNYQLQLNKIQNNVKSFQAGLKKNSPEKKFFADW